ncbi:cytochrome c3 family protein [Ferrimonas senticii]|uniref:cytochrome c3 family protein n=1 Tax=Ferrimonas senticii TaxID=394566 RepID=UPI00040E23C1|nr:cytochrome c3 family protein [Ferrimonas senticii]
MKLTQIASSLALAGTMTFAGSLAAEELLADFHVEMNGGCESCHVNDGVPSEDFVVENEQCASCHGAADELEGEHHAIHAEVLMCSDCHNPHELNVGQKPSCDNCHDDGRSAP